MFLSRIFCLEVWEPFPEIDYQPPGSAYPGEFGDTGSLGDLFSGLGDFLGGIADGVASTADFLTSAVKGAGEIIGYITDLFPSLDILSDLLADNAAVSVGVILSVMATVITFKVVGYFT